MKGAKLFVLAAFVMLAGIEFAWAQSAPAFLRRDTVYIPGLLPGPDRFGPFQRLCSLRVVGLVEWRVSVIENVTTPTAVQKAALSKLQAASAEARGLVAGACSRERPDTSVAELEVMGKRLDAVMQAFRLVQPAYVTFYDTLDARQKIRIDGLGPQRRGWRW